MGEEVAAQEFSRADRTRHREKVRRCLDVFARMLREEAFETDDPMTGLEIELNLVDDVGDPSLKNADVLAEIADPDFQTELGQFNVEINVPPRVLRDGGLTAYEENLRASLNDAESKAAKVGAHMVMIGILPTLAEGHMSPSSLSSNPRYQLLSDQILAARGEDITIDIRGVERLETTADSIVPEAACTSTQLHVQTSPDDFPAYWNASQAIAAIQLAVGANSPYLLGKELWRETRIPLFEQATDTRSEELKAQGVRPRVWFGERWITSIFDLFEENVRYFPALLPVTEDEDPLEVLENGGVPGLHELRLHNGTIYRWNRPIYDIANGVPHLRVENRLLAAGPTVIDTMANAAFYFGLVRALAEAERPLWSQMSFSAAEENFQTAARQGIEAQVYWPGVGQVRATELVLRRLLPLAYQGLAAWGVPGRRGEAVPRDHRAALPARHERCGVVREPAAHRGCLARAPGGPAADAGGLPRGDAHQRARPHLGALSRRSRLAVPEPQPVPDHRWSRTGSYHPFLVTTATQRGVSPASAKARRTGGSQARSTSWGSGVPTRVSQASGSVATTRARLTRAAAISARSPRSRASPASYVTSGPPRVPTCSTGANSRRRVPERSACTASRRSRRSRRRSRTALEPPMHPPCPTYAADAALLHSRPFAGPPAWGRMGAWRSTSPATTTPTRS